MHTLFDIEGKKVIVTGGTRGLGKGVAEGFLEAGCDVVIVGTSDKVYRVAEDLSVTYGGHCFGVKGNLGDREDVYRIFKESVEKLEGDLDVLVTAHGIQRRHPSEEFPVSEWDEVLSVNLTSLFILCQEAGKIMLKKNYGKIINFASMNSFFGGQTIPAYAAAKGGVAQMTKALSNDWAAKGINVNAIAPGYMKTEMTEGVYNDPKRYESTTDRIACHRWGTPEDMKGAAIFLASHASDYLCGCVLPVDGGYLAK
ncbi:MAG: SDR family oxidoreductase [Lachnospiraceae bacterium]|nr:SDR family oxidoreductase [Lachnospiraceae bacterium]MDD3616759.1 SDR family oxidoreductase [Lachnospiraceae bacterium]